MPAPPHVTPCPGNTHAPAASHCVAPHTPPVVHWAAQQFSMHEPLEHVWLPAHGAPAGNRHIVPAVLHVYPDAQPVVVLCVHEVAHTLPSHPKWAAQDAEPAEVQVPDPLHVSAGVNVPLEHVAGAQMVQDGNVAHAVPPGAQAPVLPHVLEACAVQSTAQHMLSTQWPLVHWSSVVHVDALAPLATQTPFAAQ
jgi:hypothetical protein